MLSPDRASWQNPRILILLLLIFFCGALAGALAMREGLHARLHRTADIQLSYESLRRELNLSPQQSEQLRSILDDMVKYHQDLQTQIEDVRATGKNRIKQILDPGQRERFNKLCDDLPAR